MRTSTAEKKKQTGADTNLSTTITLRMPLGLLDVVKRRAPEFGMGYQTFIKALVQQGLFYLNENGSLTLAVESLEEERQWRAQQRAAELEALKANRRAEKEAKDPTPAPIVKATKVKPSGKANGHGPIIVTPETLESKIKHTLVNGSGGGGHDSPHIEGLAVGGGGGGPLPAVYTDPTLMGDTSKLEEQARSLPYVHLTGEGGGAGSEGHLSGPQATVPIDVPLVEEGASSGTLGTLLNAFEEEAPTGSKVDTAALRKALLAGDDKLEVVGPVYTEPKKSTILPPPTEPPVEVEPIITTKTMGAEETAFVEVAQAKVEKQRANTVAPKDHEPLTLEDIEAMLAGDSEVSAKVEVAHVETDDVEDMMESFLAGEQEDVMRAVQKTDDDKPNAPPPRIEPAAEVTDDDLSELLAQL